MVGVRIAFPPPMSATSEFNNVEDTARIPVKDLSRETGLAAGYKVPPSISMQEMHNPPSLDDETTVPNLDSNGGTQMNEVQRRFTEQVGHPLVRKSMKCISQFTLMVLGMQYDTTLEGVVLRSIQFLDGIMDDGLVLSLKDTLLDYVSKAKITTDYGKQNVAEMYLTDKKNLPEMDTTPMKVWEALRSTIFTSHMSYIMGAVFAFSACKISNVEFSHPMYDSVVKHSSMETINGGDFIDHAVKLWGWASTVGLACIRQRSFSPMTLNSGVLAECHKQLYFWEARYEEVMRGAEITQIERSKMYIEVELINKKLQEFVTLNADKYATLSASSLHQKCLALFQKVRDYYTKIDMVEVAFAIHIWGPPAVGKSYISPMLHELFCVAKGIPYREEDVAQLNLMAKFQDEVGARTQCITINETLPCKVAISGQSAENAYVTSLALVDPVPYHPNRSNLEDKARITCQHLSVISTGNTEEPFVNVAQTPGAWTRRYVMIYMTVKPEYQNHLGEFDSSKADGTDEYHLFDIYRIAYGVGKRKTFNYFIHDGEECRQITTSAALEALRSMSITHYEAQAKMMDNRKNKKTPACLKCKRLSHMCTCTSEEATICHVVGSGEASVISDAPTAKICPDSDELATHRNVCIFDNGMPCNRCNRLPPSIPEMGLATSLSTAVVRYAWSSVSAWINPFARMNTIWSIDNCIWQSSQEKLMEELSHFPDAIGCKLLSAIPLDWIETKKVDDYGRPVVEKTTIGNLKSSFIKLLAAEKQMFVPASIIFRRAFTLSVLVFFIVTALWLTADYYEINPHRMECVGLRHSYYDSWEWIPLYPEWSYNVMQNREKYLAMGIITENYKDNKLAYAFVTPIHKLLGRIYYYWHIRRSRVVEYLVPCHREWWHAGAFFAPAYFVVSLIYMFSRRALGYSDRLKELERKASSDSDFQLSLFTSMKRSPKEYNALVPTAVGVLGAIATGLTIWNLIRNKPEQEIKRDENTTSWNSWMTFGRRVAAPAAPQNMSSDETSSRIGKHLCRMTATYKGNDRIVLGTYMKTGELMFPRHFMKPDPEKDPLLEHLDVYMECNGNKHTCRIYSASCKRIGSKDMFIVSIPKAPLMKRNITDLLPKKSGSDTHRVLLVYKNELDGTKSTFKQEPLSAKYEDDIDVGGYNVGRGLHYQSTLSGPGYCGSVIIANKRDAPILGFHISGRALDGSLRHGYCQEILYDDYMTAREELKLLPSYINQPEQSEEPDKTRLGYCFIPKDGPHPKTQMFEDMVSHPAMEVLGHDPNLARYRSKVRKSLISDAIGTHCGQPNAWKCPDMSKPWQPHNLAIQHVAEGAWEVPPDALQWAFDDYLYPLLKKLPFYKAENPELCRELTLEESVNGIAGSLFMHQANMKSSVGPIAEGRGAKSMSKLFARLEDGPLGQRRYTMTPFALKHFHYMMDKFKRGEKYGVWVKTCLKDEVVGEDSEKVRIFYILECLFAMAVRMYYLPVAEFISRNPLLCESAVGINCASEEWELTMKHVQELATDEMMTDWDFSKYDLKRSMDVMMASLNVMRKIAEHMGYSEESLKIMDGIADELRRPTVNWNGTVMHMFLWTSGNSMTVYGNGIENSLHQRISFYVNGREQLGDGFFKLGCFQDNERIITYGDDGQSGSRPEARSICNFSAKFKYFKSINMKITDASKSDDPQDVVHRDLIDFLKRQSVYHSRLGCRVGALAKSSIWKMGHMIMGSGDEDELAICLLISMLLESFLHGDIFYEEMRSNLIKVARETGIWTVFLEQDYEYRAQHWHEKYHGEYIL